MDLDESIEAFGLKIGDLVLPLETEEFLFSTDLDVDCDDNVDSIECCWANVVGLVMGVEDFIPPREYMRVQVMVDGILGWTYSDYVRVISCWVG